MPYGLRVQVPPSAPDGVKIMASLRTTVLENDIYDINDSNVEDKLKSHFIDVIKTIKFHQIKHAKVITRIKELSARQAAIYTEIDEEHWKIDVNKIKEDE